LEWYFYPLATAAGFLAGIINTLAGSGSLITLPVLILMGLPANVANGTNRVGVLLQNIVGGTSFHRSGVLDLRGALYLSVAAVLGSVAGAQIAVNLDEEMLRRTIGVVMVLMLFVIVLRPQRWLKGTLQFLEGRPTWKQLGTMFVIGIYGGFIQAGVGIFLLAALVLFIGYDLVRANAVKVIIILVFTVSALLVFARNGQVNWGIGLLVAAGQMLGAWVAARMAVEKGANWVRQLLIVIVALSASYLLGLFDLLAGLFS
jgi:uncharacterized membrane protein YfcA